MKERIYYKSFRDCKKENADNFRIIFSTQKEFEIFFFPQCYGNCGW